MCGQSVCEMIVLIWFGFEIDFDWFWLIWLLFVDCCGVSGYAFGICPSSKGWVTRGLFKRHMLCTPHCQYRHWLDWLIFAGLQLDLRSDLRIAIGFEIWELSWTTLVKQWDGWNCVRTKLMNFFWKEWILCYVRVHTWSLSQLPANCVNHFHIDDGWRR